MIFTCMLSSMLSGGRKGGLRHSPTKKNQEKKTWSIMGISEDNCCHLHAVPSSEVFVDDLPASKVAHSARDLDGHVNQVLLRDGLTGNGRSAE